MLLNIFWILIFCVFTNVWTKTPLAKDNFPFLEKQQNGQYRLPGETIPIAYKLTLETKNIQNEEFDYIGTVEITIEAKRQTSNIRLHSRDLEIESVEVKQGASEPFMKTFKNQSDYDFLDIELNKNLEIGQKYVIIIKYNGVLKDVTQGFFHSSYIDEKGDIKRLAATQFEPTHARSAFPCYDEPGLKAKFTLIIRHLKTLTAVSNAIGVKRDDPSDQEYSITEFPPTDPIMSTYLLAFAITDFESIANEDFKTSHVIYARSNALQFLNTSLTFSVDVLDKLEKYIDVPYSYKHMQQIAIPDFAGAMENWALVTYKEENLIFNTLTGTNQQLNGMKLTIAHEFAHQWFGNLVTCQWWKYNWLNEGFATFFEYMAQDIVAPLENFGDRIVVEKLQLSMIQDASENTRAMSTDAETPLGISSLFDGIAYDKGGSVLRMFQHAMGAETFRLALQAFIKDNLASSVVDTDLFRAFEDAIGTALPNVKLRDFFNSWTTQKGFPVVTATRDYENRKIQLSQKRFTYNSQSLDDTLWIIPLSIVNANNSLFNNTGAEFWMPQSKTYDVEIDNNDLFYVINVKQTGYYRVNYDNENWDRIIQHLMKMDDDEEQNIHSINRAQIIDDVFNLARAGQVSYNLAFRLSFYLVKETEYLPWAAFDANLQFLHRMLYDTVEYFRLASHVYVLMNPLFEDLGFDHNNSDLVKAASLRNIILNWICFVENGDDCRRKAKARLNDFLENTSLILPNLKPIVYCYGLTVDNVDELWKIFEKLIDQAERGLIIDALGCLNDFNKLYDLLEKTGSASKTYNGFRRAERNRLFESILKNKMYGGELAIKYLKENYIFIKQHYNNAKALQIAVLNTANYITNDKLKNMFNELLTLLSTELDASIITSARDAADEIGKWREKYQKDVDNWLVENYSDTATSNMISFLVLILSFLLVRLL